MVGRWQRRYREDGVAGLVPSYEKGRRSRLTPEVLKLIHHARTVERFGCRPHADLAAAEASDRHRCQHHPARLREAWGSHSGPNAETTRGARRHSPRRSAGRLRSGRREVRHGARAPILPVRRSTTPRGIASFVPIVSSMPARASPFSARSSESSRLPFDGCSPTATPSSRWRSG